MGVDKGGLITPGRPDSEGRGRRRWGREPTDFIQKVPIRINFIKRKKKKKKKGPKSILAYLAEARNRKETESGLGKDKICTLCRNSRFVR